MADLYTSNLIIYTGTNFEQSFVFEETSSNSLKDFTGYTGCAQMRRYESSSSKAADFTVTFATDRTSGRVTVGLGTTVTTDLKAGKYFYDLLLSAPTGLTEKGVQGTAIVKKSVTRI